MRKFAYLTLGILAGLSMLVGISYRIRSVQAVNIRFNVKDLPEHGLKIIAPSNPTYETLMTALAKNNPDLPVEAIKPFSVFIKYTGEKDVMAYKLRWECIKSDGTIVFKDTSSSAASLLLGAQEGTEYAQALASSTTIMRHDSTWFYSLGGLPRRLDNSPLASVRDSGWAVVTNKDNAEQIQKLERAPNDETILSAINNELARYSSVNIILDGVLFSDGSFAGGDSSGFFGALKAEFDAEYDLLLELRARMQEGKTHAEVFQVVEKLTLEPDVEISPTATESDYYRYFKKRSAAEYLGQKNKLGLEVSMQKALKKLDRPRIKLRKI